MHPYAMAVLKELVAIINRPHTPRTLLENTGQFASGHVQVICWSHGMVTVRVASYIMWLLLE